MLRLELKELRPLPKELKEPKGSLLKELKEPKSLLKSEPGRG